MNALPTECWEVSPRPLTSTLCRETHAGKEQGALGLEPRRPARAAHPGLPPEAARRTDEFLGSRSRSPQRGSAQLTLQLQVPLPQLGVPLFDLLAQEFHL